MAGIRDLTKHSIIYGLGPLSGQIVKIILLPMYAHYLSPADFGVVALMLLITDIARSVCNCGMMQTITRQIKLKGDNPGIVATTALVFLVTLSAVAFGGLLLLAPRLSRLVLNSPDYDSYIRLLLVSSFLATPELVVNALLRIEKRSGLFTLMSGGRITVNLTLNVVFVAVLDLGVYGLVLANLLTHASTAAMHCVILIPRVLAAPIFSAPLLGAMLKVGLPLMPNRIFNKVMTSADRLFLLYFLSESAVGLYSIGYRIGTLVLLGVSAVHLAWPVHMYELVKRPDAKKQIARHVTYWVAAFAFIGLGVSLFARDAILILTKPEFEKAASVVPLIAAACFLFGLRSMVNGGMLTTGKTYYMPFLLGGSALINVLANALLVPRYGMLGAAWASLASYAALCAVQWLIDLKLWFIRYEYGRLVKILVATALIGLLSSLLPNFTLAASLGTKFCLVTLFPAVLFGLGFFTEKERKVLKRALKRITHQYSH